MRGAAVPTIQRPLGQDNLLTGKVQTWRKDQPLCQLTLTLIHAKENQASFLKVCTQ